MSPLMQEGSESFGGGMVDSVAGTKYEPDEVELLLNARALEDETIEPVGGTQKVSATALAGEGFLGYEFQPAVGLKQWLLAGGDTLYYSTDRGATRTVIDDGFAEDHWDVAEYQIGSVKYVALANGGDHVYQWDGETLTELTEWPAGINRIEWHNQALWGGGHDGARILRSKLNDPSLVAVADGGWEAIVPLSEGDTIITALKSKGAALWVYKRRSITPIFGFDESDLEIGDPVSDSDGCVAFRTITNVAGDGVAWLAEGRIKLWSPAGGLQTIGRKLDGFLRRLSWGDIIASPGIPCGCYLAERNELVFAVPAASNRNDFHVLLNLDTQAPALVRIGTEQGFTYFRDAGGYGRISLDATRSQVRVEAGYERVATGREAGGFLTIDADGYVRRLTAEHDTAVLFPADRSDQNAAPVAIGYDGHVRWFDYGDAFDAAVDASGGTPVVGVVVIRPLLYGKPNHKKQAVEADVLVVADQALNVVMRMIADGREGADILIPFLASHEEKPGAKLVKPRGYRAKALQARLEIPRGGRLAAFYLRSMMDTRAH